MKAMKATGKAKVKAKAKSKAAATEKGKARADDVPILLKPRTDDWTEEDLLAIIECMPEEARPDDDEREPGRKSYTKAIESITMVEVKERFDEIRGDVEAKSKIEVLLTQKSFYVTNVEAVPLKHDGTPYSREPK